MGLMRKVEIIGVLSMLLVAFSASAALAVSPHEVPNNPIVCTKVGTAVECAGSIAGLGTGETVIIQVVADLACETRSGSNQPGGHLQGTTEPITAEHGRVDFDVTTDAAKCPRGLNPVVG